MTAHRNAGRCSLLFGGTRPSVWTAIAVVVFGVVQTLHAQTPGDAETATLEHPSTVAARAMFDVVWDGPANRCDYNGRRRDYIDIAPAGRSSADGELLWQSVSRFVSGKEASPRAIELTRCKTGPTLGDVVNSATAGAVAAKVREPIIPLGFSAPAQPGTYEVRYISAEGNWKNRKVLARSTLTVEGNASTEITLSAPTSAEPGETLTIQWSGPAASRDYIDIVKAGQTGFRPWEAYVYASKGSPATLNAPRTAGRYTIRFVVDNNRQPFVAAEQSLTVEE